jgi:hypothetical protein
MTVANTLTCNDMATITAVKSFIVKASAVSALNTIETRFCTKKALVEPTKSPN